MCSSNKLIDMWGGIKSLPLSKLLLYLFIFATPLMVYPIDVMGCKIPIREIRQIMFVSMALIICSYLQANRWLRYFIVWCIINWWLNYFMPNSSSIGLFLILCGLVLYIGISKLLETKMLSVNRIVLLFCFTSIIQIIWIVLQYFGKDPVFYSIDMWGLPNALKGMPIVGWSGNPSILAVSLAITSFLFLNRGKVWFFIILIAIILLKSFTGMLCICVGSLFYLFCSHLLTKKVTLQIAIVSILLVIFGLFIKHPNIDRIYIWNKLIYSAVNLRPIVGRGLNFFSQLQIVDKTGTIWTEAHNDYLQIFLELGLIGLGLFIMFIISIFKDFFSKVRCHRNICIMSSIVAFLVSGISLFPMHLAQLSFYAIVLLACLNYDFHKSCTISK